VRGKSNWRYLIVAALGSGSCLTCCTSPPQYTVRGDAPVGTQIGQHVGDAGGLPLNRRYDELNDGEKLRVREMVARYDDRLESDGEPPFPLDGLKPVYQSFQAEYQEFVQKGRYRYPWQGTFTLIAAVEADGQVVRVTQQGLSPADIGRTTAGVVRHTKFKPAVCHGQPCRMNFPFRVNFIPKEVDSSGRFH
jgi:hypothetical protein